MTDKEIIIDGVNISECKHYEKHSFYDCNETCEDNGAIVCTNCKDNQNCYYKQLARKTAECEELKKENEELQKQCKNLEKWCTALKEDNVAIGLTCDQFERECNKYEQALNEIELSVTNLISSCDKCPDNKNGYCIGIDECSSKCFKKLLDIIKSAKDINVPHKKDGNNE